MLSTGEAARRAGVSVSTIRNAINSGDLDAEMAGGRYMVDEDALDAWMAEGEEDDEEEDDDE